jgi:ribosome-binding factor A
MPAPLVPIPVRRPSFRQQKLAAAVYEILAPAFLEAGQLSEALQGQSFAVMGVEASPNLQDVKIFLEISVLSQIDQSRDPAILPPVIPLKLLKKITPQIRSFLAARLSLRRMPNLHFYQDSHWQNVSKISKLIESLPQGEEPVTD